jgi:hypothetical protein
MKRMMHELHQGGSSLLQEDPTLDINSQRRSSMTSMEVPADEHDAQMIDDAPGPRYPVDDVREMTNCELHQPMKNMSFKVAIDTALPCLREALHHGNPIPAGYARVSVDEIAPGFEDLDIDFATPEGDVRLGDVKRYIGLWQKKYIKFPRSAPRPPTPRNPSPPSPGECRPPTPPPVHLRHRVSRRYPQCTSHASADAAPQCTFHASADTTLPVHLPCVRRSHPLVHLPCVRRSRPQYYPVGKKTEQGRYS